MKMIPVRWSIQRKEFTFILEALGESNQKDSESYIIASALDIIDIAIKSKGVLYKGTPTVSSKCKCSVSFLLIFPSENDINNFLGYFYN